MRWDAERHAHDVLDVPVDGCMGIQSDATETSRRSCAHDRRDVVTWSAPAAQTKDGATGHILLPDRTPS